MSDERILLTLRQEIVGAGLTVRAVAKNARVPLRRAYRLVEATVTPRPGELAALLGALERLREREAGQ